VLHLGAAELAATGPKTTAGSPRKNAGSVVVKVVKSELTLEK